MFPDVFKTLHVTFSILPFLSAKGFGKCLNAFGNLGGRLNMLKTLILERISNSK